MMWHLLKGLYQANMLSYIWRTRIVSQGISAALQYSIRTLFGHSLYLLKIAASATGI